MRAQTVHGAHATERFARCFGSLPPSRLAIPTIPVRDYRGFKHVPDETTTDVGVFFRDVYDHTVRTAEMIEASREVLASMTELYLSTVSQRMNEIMKVLAVISTFFLPLTFIAGLYGMNFDPGASPLNMPELDWYYGYPFALTLMAAIAVVMFVFFRRRGWL